MGIFLFNVMMLNQAFCVVRKVLNMIFLILAVGMVCRVTAHKTSEVPVVDIIVFIVVSISAAYCMVKLVSTNIEELIEFSHVATETVEKISKEAHERYIKVFDSLNIGIVSFAKKKTNSFIPQLDIDYMNKKFKDLAKKWSGSEQTTEDKLIDDRRFFRFQDEDCAEMDNTPYSLKQLCFKPEGFLIDTVF